MSLQTGEQNYLQILGREIRKLASSSDYATNLILDIYHPLPKTNENATVSVAPKIEKLSRMSLNAIFKAYKKGSVHSNIQLCDKIWFGQQLDVNKKLEDIIDLDNEEYWRKVAEMDCTDKIALMNAMKSKRIYWKAFGVECRFTKLLENTSPSDFLEEKFIPLAKLVCGYITNLNIKQMIPLKEELVKKSIYNPRYVYRNYPSEFCHHARLGVVLNELTNLTNLSLEYGLRKCQYNYKKRFFEISYEDIEDLAGGMKALTKLKTFRFRHTRLNDEKLRILTLALVTLQSLETLELMYCNLTDNSGMAMGHLLQNHSGLKSLNLKGNQIHAIGCQGIGYGLQQRREPLDFLGLSRCPIGTEGICRIGGALKGTVHCPKLDLSFCSLGENGSMFIAELFSFHKHIVTLNISGTPLGYSNGEMLIKYLKDCFCLIELDCRSCCLTRGQESKLKIIVERNNYYKHHPYLLKERFTEKDEDDIEELLEDTRRSDIEKLYENCEIITPQKDVYPDSLGGMTSTYVSDFPENFLSDLNTDSDGNEIKVIRSTTEEKS